MIKYQEIKNLSPRDLRSRYQVLEKNLFEAHMKKRMQRLSNIMEIRDMRRDLARLKTAIALALPQQEEEEEAGQIKVKGKPPSNVLESSTKKATLLSKPKAEDVSKPKEKAEEAKSLEQKQGVLTKEKTTLIPPSSKKTREALKRPSTKEQGKKSSGFFSRIFRRKK